MQLRLSSTIGLFLNDVEHCRELHVPAFSLHPSFLNIDYASFENIRLAVTARTRAHKALGDEFQHGCRQPRALEMQSCCVQPLRRGIKLALNDVGAQHMSAEGIRVAEEVCQGDGGKGVVVGVVLAIEFHHDVGAVEDVETRCEVPMGAFMTQRLLSTTESLVRR